VRRFEDVCYRKLRKVFRPENVRDMWIYLDNLMTYR